MDKNTCTFVSYNSTGMNSVKTKWIRDLINVTNADFISVQEHFKMTKSLEKYFCDEFPNNSSFVVRLVNQARTVAINSDVGGTGRLN